jgi:hypothetical protein
MAAAKNAVLSGLAATAASLSRFATLIRTPTDQASER